MENSTKTKQKPIKLEYIYIDHFGTIRAKTRIWRKPLTGPEDLPLWNYLNFHKEGQEMNIDYVVLLKPVALFDDPFRGPDHKLVLTEALNMDKTPHYTNHRAKAVEVTNKAEADNEPRFGVEQEYMIFSRQTAFRKGKEYKVPFLEEKRIPYKWLAHDNPGEHAWFLYEDGLGGAGMFGREIAEEHLDLCLAAGLMIEGVNSESTPSQWEYQIGVCDGIELADHLVISRYILLKLSEKYEVHISFKPRPYRGVYYFGSGLHTNFSTKQMREGVDGKKGIEFVEEAAELLCKQENHVKHLAEYGDNSERLRGGMCMGSLDKTTWGKCDRNCSIRIPAPTVVDGKGYLEDRRPASDADPYRIVTVLVQTLVLKE